VKASLPPERRTPIRPVSLSQDSEIEKGARPPRALFSAPSRKTVGRSKKFQTNRHDDIMRSAGREARPRYARGGRAPQHRSLGLIHHRAVLEAGAPIFPHGRLVAF
jgi:hypothetical protein